MDKKIIVTEKPSVARTFAQVLGVHGNNDGYIENDEWIITWCVGHLVTLSYPEEYDPDLKVWDMNTLPFLPNNYRYHVIPDVKKQFNVIKKLYNRKDIGAIYYAGDPAREGIYIQMLVRQEAGHNPNAKELVVWIDSQTTDEIRRGIKEAKPLSEYQNLADSGYMRAIEDYALGINFSRVLTLKYRGVTNMKKPIAVGRVMTCVLGMIVEREREIENFVPTKFYKIQSRINLDGEDLIATWKAGKESNLFKEGKLYNETGFHRKDDAANFIKSLGRNLIIESIVEKQEKKFAPLLYNLAELQSACSKILHISPDRTLDLVQKLYEQKLVTYPRTDARVLSSAIAKEIDRNLKGLRGYSSELDDCLNKCRSTNGIEKSRYVDDSKIADHYAIIPTGQNMSSAASLSGEMKAVYELIVKRFVSIFMPPAVYKKLSIVEKDDKLGERFYANGSSLVDPGYLACAGIPTDKNALPPNASNLAKDSIHAGQFRTCDGETKPPSRYTSGSMILAMENAGNLIEDEELRAQIKGSGIGTSATRAEVIKKLVKNTYIKLNSKTQVLTPDVIGYIVYEIVKDAVPELLSPKMTAGWEKGLDLVATGNLSADRYEEKLNEFIAKIVQSVKTQEISPKLTVIVGGYSKDIKQESPAKKFKTTAECYLNVPFNDRDEAKALGAFWDANAKSWYVPKGKDPKPFEKWIGESSSKSSPKKVYLKVPFDEKDEAKSCGARWDQNKKSWYIMSNMDKSKFVKWA